MESEESPDNLALILSEFSKQNENQNRKLVKSIVDCIRGKRVSDQADGNSLRLKRFKSSECPNTLLDLGPAASQPSHSRDSGGIALEHAS